MQGISENFISDFFFPDSGELPYRLTNDYLFRAVLQEDAETLKHLISALLDISYEEIVSCIIKNPIVLGEAIDAKTVVLDVRVLLNNNRLINLEMQTGNLTFWPERSMYYLCKLYCNLKSGQNYQEILPSVHIGILPKSPFPEMTEFYSQYLMMNRENHHIFTSKFSLHMLCLDQLDNVSEEMKSSELYLWAKLFAASTWEEIRMLTEKSDVIKNTAHMIYKLSAEENIRLLCEGRERYEHDRASLLYAGRQEGQKIGEEIGEQRGIKKGEMIGEERGKAEATALLNQLNQMLIADGRMDDLAHSTEDPAYQKLLLEEYHLISNEDK